MPRIPWEAKGKGRAITPPSPAQAPHLTLTRARGEHYLFVPEDENNYDDGNSETGSIDHIIEDMEEWSDDEFRLTIDNLRASAKALALLQASRPDQDHDDTITRRIDRADNVENFWLDHLAQEAVSSVELFNKLLELNPAKDDPGEDGVDSIVLDDDALDLLDREDMGQVADNMSKATVRLHVAQRELAEDDRDHPQMARWAIRTIKFKEAYAFKRWQFANQEDTSDEDDQEVKGQSDEDDVEVEVETEDQPRSAAEVEAEANLTRLAESMVDALAEGHSRGEPLLVDAGALPELTASASEPAEEPDESVSVSTNGHTRSAPTDIVELSSDSDAGEGGTDEFERFPFGPSSEPIAYFGTSEQGDSTEEEEAEADDDQPEGPHVHDVVQPGEWDSSQPIKFGQSATKEGPAASHPVRTGSLPSGEKIHGLPPFDFVYNDQAVPLVDSDPVESEEVAGPPATERAQAGAGVTDRSTTPLSLTAVERRADTDKVGEAEAYEDIPMGEEQSLVTQVVDGSPDFDEEGDEIVVLGTQPQAAEPRPSSPITDFMADWPSPPPEDSAAKVEFDLLSGLTESNVPTDDALDELVDELDREDTAHAVATKIEPDPLSTVQPDLVPDENEMEIDFNDLPEGEPDGLADPVAATPPQATPGPSEAPVTVKVDDAGEVFPLSEAPSTDGGALIEEGPPDAIDSATFNLPPFPGSEAGTPGGEVNSMDGFGETDAIVPVDFGSEAEAGPSSPPSVEEDEDLDEEAETQYAPPAKESDLDEISLIVCEEDTAAPAEDDSLLNVFRFHHQPPIELDVAETGTPTDDAEWDKLKLDYEPLGRTPDFETAYVEEDGGTALELEPVQLEPFPCTAPASEAGSGEPVARGEDDEEDVVVAAEQDDEEQAGVVQAVTELVQEVVSSDELSREEERQDPYKPRTLYDDIPISAMVTELRMDALRRTEDDEAPAAESDVEAEQLPPAKTPTATLLSLLPTAVGPSSEDSPDGPTLVAAEDDLVAEDQVLDGEVSSSESDSEDQVALSLVPSTPANSAARNKSGGRSSDSALGHLGETSQTDSPRRKSARLSSVSPTEPPPPVTTPKPVRRSTHRPSVGLGPDAVSPASTLASLPEETSNTGTVREDSPRATRRAGKRSSSVSLADAEPSGTRTTKRGKSGGSSPGKRATRELETTPPPRLPSDKTRNSQGKGAGAGLHSSPKGGKRGRQEVDEDDLVSTPRKRAARARSRSAAPQALPSAAEEEAIPPVRRTHSHVHRTDTGISTASARAGSASALHPPTSPSAHATSASTSTSSASPSQQATTHFTRSHCSFETLTINSQADPRKTYKFIVPACAFSTVQAHETMDEFGAARGPEPTKEEEARAVRLGGADDGGDGWGDFEGEEAVEQAVHVIVGREMWDEGDVSWVRE